MLDLSILNKEQKEAVETTEGPVLVLAGAGSGKTRVLTYRIAYILGAGLAGPNNILAMTFTNKAAGEMKERIAHLISNSQVSISSKRQSEGVSLPWMGTFHSIGVKMLKIYGEHVGLNRNFTIYDSSDQLSAVKEAMEKLSISIKDVNPNTVKNYISSAKNELIEPEDYYNNAAGYFQQVVSDVYPEYNKILRESNAVDFDDLILLTIKLLRNNEHVLKRFQDDFKYILVDEYQDTNHAQYMMIQMLAKKYKNICVVGDDDQSIYSFRGATIKNILSFEKDYPETKVIKLEQNYRSTKTILEASHQVISKNKARKDKKLWTENHEGNQIILYTAKNEVDEGSWIVEKIIENHDLDELKYNDVALLYRTNAQSRSLEEAFVNYGIPYRIIGGVRFYERKEIKDVLAYLKLLHNPKDNINLERIINVPRRGIGDKTVQDLKSEAGKAGMSVLEFLVDENTKSQIGNSKVLKFAELIWLLNDRKKTLTIIDLINFVIDRTDYIKMLSDGTLENEARIENIKELITVAAKFDSLPPEEGLAAFLDEVSLLEGAANNQEIQDAVTLMTIHASKGLEFRHVFIVGMEENLFPHSNSMFDDKQLEEERRLAYVAITRAMQKLYITHAKTRLYFGRTSSNSISRFVNDIDGGLLDHVAQDASDRLANIKSYNLDDNDNFRVNIDLEKGDRVKHEYFGVGTIKYMDDEMIEVDFGSIYGVKELMLEYAKLEKIG